MALLYCYSCPGFTFFVSSLSSYRFCSSHCTKHGALHKIKFFFQIPSISILSFLYPASWTCPGPTATHLGYGNRSRSLRDPLSWSINSRATLMSCLCLCLTQVPLNGQTRSFGPLSPPPLLSPADLIRTTLPCRSFQAHLTSVLFTLLSKSSPSPFLFAWLVFASPLRHNLHLTQFSHCQPPLPPPPHPSSLLCSLFLNWH